MAIIPDTEKAAGYVVQEAKESNRFLSRSGRFLKRRDRGSKLGIERAYVHTSAELLEMRDCIPLTSFVFRGRYNTEVDFTGISCNPPMKFEEFLEIYQQFVSFR